ncbi:hypothetical protein LTR08_001785 [Meristemomyces frigidus]|nr:hypothetical protein LTR08_001785 [Meristemomyces frigidus]
MTHSTTTYPAPLEFLPSWSLDGDDGDWATFTIGVGTPPQYFRVLPSTSGAEIWVPLPEGCQGIMANVSNCGDLRGVNDATRGFQTNSSSSWETIGIYGLSTEQPLFGSSNDGLYGLDTVASQSVKPGSIVSHDLSSQTVAGISSADFWLGSLGLGTATGNFTVQNENIPSMLDTLYNQSLIPSLSFGYAAGAGYISPPDYGSLVLGGYDKSRFTPTNLSMSLGGPSKQTLELSLKSIVAQNVFGGTLSLLANGDAISTVIDSTVTQLWLPQDVCDLFAQAFGLTYDPVTELYLVNDTIHSQLLLMSPSVTFTIGANSTSADSTNIELPYAAFDLGAGIPIYNSTTPYFPIRVAANESQYVLGRSFLQEAYLSVDWERQNFTVAQVVHQNETTSIVSVLSPSDTYTATTHKSLKPGVVAGITVVACATLVFVAGLILFFVLRNRRRRRAAEAEQAEQAAVFLSDQKGDPKGSVSELHGDQSTASEIMSQQVYEMHDNNNNNKQAHKIMSNSLTELPGHAVGQELDGESAQSAREKEEMKRKAVEASVYEMP